MSIQDEAIRRAAKVQGIVEEVTAMVRAVNDNEDPGAETAYQGSPPNEWAKAWAERIVKYVIEENLKGGVLLACGQCGVYQDEHERADHPFVIR